ncbi:hypothetical protein HYQ46_010911 [Verticillium longisporum]|nr:hypothetical protein HYQ46_010911 [Verticillium longisporum]
MTPPLYEANPRPKQQPPTRPQPHLNMQSMPTISDMIEEDLVAKTQEEDRLSWRRLHPSIQPLNAPGDLSQRVVNHGRIIVMSFHNVIGKRERAELGRPAHGIWPTEP